MALGHTGVANLPLHGGKCPTWLFSRMKELAGGIVEIMVEEYGPGEVVRRLADPFWFQALGCVLGFDWHSSGVTTTVCGAIKEAVRGKEAYLGLFIAGGKGKASLRTPQEIAAYGDRLSLPRGFSELVKISRLVAKVDNSAVQDGFHLYHHVLFFTQDGLWGVVQQGLNDENGMARRYHWLSEVVADFTCEPHAAICCDQHNLTLNMVAAESESARQASTELSHLHPDRLAAELKQILAERSFTLPGKHAVPQASYIEKALLKTYEQQPADFQSLLLTRGVGPSTIRALALLSEVIYGAAPSFQDPVRYSFAHGGKDGHPYPVNRQVYDQSIEVLRQALGRARVGQSEKLAALRRLAGLGAEAAQNHEAKPEAVPGG